MKKQPICNLVNKHGAQTGMGEAGKAPPIKTFFKNRSQLSKYKPCHPKQRDFKNKVVRWVIVNKRPLSVVEDEKLVEAFGVADPRLKMPTRWEVTKEIRKLFKIKEAATVEELSRQDYFCCTNDAGSSSGARSFVDMNIHYVNENFEQCSNDAQTMLRSFLNDPNDKERREMDQAKVDANIKAINTAMVTAKFSKAQLSSLRLKSEDVTRMMSLVKVDFSLFAHSPGNLTLMNRAGEGQNCFVSLDFMGVLTDQSYLDEIFNEALNVTLVCEDAIHIWAHKVVQNYMFKNLNSRLNECSLLYRCSTCWRKASHCWEARSMLPAVSFYLS